MSPADLNGDDDAPPSVAVDTEEAVRAVGNRIRALRKERGLTLGTVSERTGLSVSLLSMVERGRSGPSIGTLVAIAGAFGVHMSDLFERGAEDTPADPVHRKAHQPSFETAAGVTRRVVQSDDGRGFELAVNEYAPGTTSSGTPVHHDGHEVGVVLDGNLTVELDGSIYVLRAGDAIAYDSQTPHRLRNDSKRRVRAVWVNFDR